MDEANIVVVEDHEEWTKVVEDSESGVYVAQAFVVYNTDTEIFVSSLRLAKRVFRRLFKRQGWDMRFAPGVSPLKSYSAPEPTDPNSGMRGSYETDLSKGGGWFATVPIDYLDELDDPTAMVFDLDEEEPRFSVWAAEATAKRTQGKGFLMLPEFGYTVENAFVGGTLQQYHDHPQAEELARRFGAGR